MNKSNFYFFSSILVLLITVVIGGLSLYETFSGDQALFLTFGQQIDNGAILYRDLWDIKQPAIFVFYLIAGKLFGFNEFGVHLLEMIYWIALSIFLLIFLRKYFTNSAFAILTPLFTIDIYYSVSSSWHLTQAESLVCFPIFLTLWFCQKFLENPDKKSNLFLSGIFAGIVFLFKQMLFVIPLLFWFGAFIYAYFLLKKSFKILPNLGLILLGFLSPIALVIAYFAQNNSLDILFYSTFVYPYQAAISVSEGDRTQILYDGLKWFLRSYFPIIFLSFLWIIWQIKNLKANIKSNNFLFNGLFLWAIFGFAIILIQRLSWWEYHYSLLMLPLGILAVKALDCVWETLETQSKINWKNPLLAITSMALLILFVPTARRLNQKINQSLEVQTVKIGEKDLKISGGNLENYHSIMAETAFLINENPKPKIFVMGEPLYYYLSDSTQAISSNGWMPTLFTKAEWEKLNAEVIEKNPDYIFLRKDLIDEIKTKNPDFFVILEKKYSFYSNGERTAVYKLKQQI